MAFLSMSSHQKTAYFGEILPASEQNEGVLAGCASRYLQRPLIADVKVTLVESQGSVWLD